MRRWVARCTSGQPFAPTSVSTVERSEDARVAARLQAGDDSALAELYDAHGAVVFGLAARITGDRTVAEDLTQEVFVSLWQRPDAFDASRGSFRGFLATMARRRSIDWVRSAVARQRREDRDGREPVNVPDPGDLVTLAAVSSEVRGAVDRLPEPQREALCLAYYGGLSYREVAVHLQIPEGTAKTRLRSALQTLTTQLSDWGAT